MRILSKQLPKHPIIIIFEIHHTFMLLWIPASTYPTTTDFVQTFFLKKVWMEDTLPTYNLDIGLKFRSFFYYPSPYSIITI